MKSIKVFEILQKVGETWKHYNYLEERPLMWYGEKGIMPFDECQGFMAIEKEIEPQIIDLYFAPPIYNQKGSELQGYERFSAYVVKYPSCIIFSPTRIYSPFKQITHGEINGYINGQTTSEWAKVQHETICRVLNYKN